MKTDSFCEELGRIEFHRAAVNVNPLFDLALHTDEPVGDEQKQYEVKLEGYARVQVLRDDRNWDVSGRTISNAQIIAFPTITKGTATVTFLSIGIDGKIRRTVKLKEPISLKPNRRVEFDPGVIQIVEKE